MCGLTCAELQYYDYKYIRPRCIISCIKNAINYCTIPFNNKKFNLNFGSGIQLTELYYHFNLKC